MRDPQGSMQFFYGSFDGRDMTVVSSSREQVKLSGSPTGTYIGALCQNGETAGRAIRLTPIVLDGVSRSWTAAPFY